MTTQNYPPESREGVRYGQTTNFLNRRNELWMNRNLREQRRIAGIRGRDPQYYPGIRVRDIRRGPDFYTQEEMLVNNNDYYEEEARLILNEDSGESDEEAQRENFIHDNYMNVFYGIEPTNN